MELLYQNGCGTTIHNCRNGMLRVWFAPSLADEHLDRFTGLLYIEPTDDHNVNSKWDNSRFSCAFLHDVLFTFKHVVRTDKRNHKRSYILRRVREAKPYAYPKKIVWRFKK